MEIFLGCNIVPQNIKKKLINVEDATIIPVVPVVPEIPGDIVKCIPTKLKYNHKSNSILKLERGKAILGIFSSEAEYLIKIYSSKNKNDAINET